MGGGLHYSGEADTEMCRVFRCMMLACTEIIQTTCIEEDGKPPKSVYRRTSHHAIYAHKLLRALGPRGQLHIRDHCAILHHSQAVTVGIDKHLGEVVELWDQLLHGDSTEMHFKLCSSNFKTYNNKKKKRKKTLQGLIWLLAFDPNELICIVCI